MCAKPESRSLRTQRGELHPVPGRVEDPASACQDTMSATGMTIAEEDEELESLPEAGLLGVSDSKPSLTAEELNHSLATAVVQNDAMKLSEALEQGADPCFRDEKHWNPLLWASFYGHHEVSTTSARPGSATGATRLAHPGTCSLADCATPA